MLAGNTISKVILTLGGMFLAKFYGPESYGIYSVFLSYVMILPVLASFRLENIMILQKGSSEIRNLFSGIIWLSLIFTILIICVLCIIKYLGLIVIDLSFILLMLCGIGAVLTAWNHTQNALFTKFKLFKQMSTAFVISSLFAVAFQSIFYLIDLSENGLIYGWLVGLTASFLFNASVSKNRFSKVNLNQFKESIRQHSRIIKYTYPSDSLNAVANNIMPILVITYFTSIEVGVYGLALKVLSTPLLILSSSVSRVYFQKSVNLYNHDKNALWSLTKRVIWSNLGLIMLFVLAMNTVGVYLLNLFFQDSWPDLSAYVLALSFWILARSTMHPIASIILVIKKNHYSLIFNAYLLIVNILAIYLGVLKNDFLFCVWIFSILSGIGYITLVLTILFKLRKDVSL